MEQLWRGDLPTRLRLASGLVLFVYVLFHLLNIGTAMISPELADAFQEARMAVFRSLVGTLLLYGALLTHAGLGLARLATRRISGLTLRDWVQAGLGIAIPLLLAVHVVYTRAAYEQFGIDTEIAYVAGLIWNTPSGWKQALLILVVWVHAAIGLNAWLSGQEWWRDKIALWAGMGVFVPAFAVGGFVSEGRRAKALLSAGGPEAEAFKDAINWPDGSTFVALNQWTEWLLWAIWAVLSVAFCVLIARHLIRPGGKLSITYEDGHVIRAKPGPTLLDLSRAADVPHTSLCGGRGRCSTCRVVIDAGGETLPEPSASERRVLQAVGAGPETRLACQIRPTAPLTIHRVFSPDGTLSRAHASDGREAVLAVMFLDMRGFTARTSGQLPYDVVFLLNRFFDAMVPAIRAEGGYVDKYLGDGLLALFDAPDARMSARSALDAISGIEAALKRFNQQLTQEGSDPVQIGIGLHLGALVIGELGAAGQSARTLIGDTVNTASRLEACTKGLSATALISAPVLEAAEMSQDALDLIELELRGLSEPLSTLVVPYGQTLQSCLTGKATQVEQSP